MYQKLGDRLLQLFLQWHFLWQSKCDKIIKIQTQGCKRSKPQTQGCKRSKLQTQRCKRSKLQIQECKRSKLQTQGCKKIKVVNSKVQKYRGQIYLCVHTTTIIKYLWGNKLVVKQQFQNSNILFQFLDTAPRSWLQYAPVNNTPHYPTPVLYRGIDRELTGVSP